MKYFSETSVQIAVLAVVLFALVLVIARKWYDKRLKKAIYQSNMVEYGRLLNSRWALILLDPNRISLLRAIYSLDMNDNETGVEQIAKVNYRRLKSNEKGLYVQTASSLAMNLKDQELYQHLGEVIEELSQTEENEVMINQIKNEYQINKKLYFDFDSSVIEDLNQQIQKADSKVNKGMICLSLAKAYHLNHQDQLAKETLRNAEKLLENTKYVDVITEIRKDIRLLD